MDICTAHSMCRIYPFEGAVSLERVGEHYWTDTNHECFSHAHILVPSKMSIEFSVGTILIFARAIGPSQRAKVFAALMPMTQPHKQITINYNAVYVFGTDYTKQSTFQTKNGYKSSLLVVTTMAPREPHFIGNYDREPAPKCKIYTGGLGLPSSSAVDEKSYESQKIRGKTAVRRRLLGKLRFGLHRHGISGLVSLGLLIGCLVFPDLPRFFLLAVIVATSFTALSSRNLLSQVPRSTRISSWIIPPHKEAFKRTISVVLYLNIRLAWSLAKSVSVFGSTPGGDKSFAHGWADLVFAVVLAAFHTRYFFPYGADFANGNTYIFMVPMWIGLGIDAVKQFPSLSPAAGEVAATSVLISLAAFREALVDPSTVSLTWAGVSDWNERVINEQYLLVTLLCTMQVAFLFTLAFRGFVNIHTCYWTAAGVVAALATRVFLSVSL